MKGTGEDIVGKGPGMNQWMEAVGAMKMSIWVAEEQKKPWNLAELRCTEGELSMESVEAASGQWGGRRGSEEARGAVLKAG